MKRAKVIMSLLGAGYLVLGIGMASPALADSKHDDRCGNRSLKGTYIFTQDGFENRRVSTATLPEPYKSTTALVPADRRPYGYAGRETYDGQGHVAGINTVAQARGATFNPPTNPATPVAQPVNVSGFVGYSGIYTLDKENCTAVVTLQDDPDPTEPPAPGDPVFVSKYHLFLSPDGEKFTFIVFSASVVQNDIFVEDAQELTGVGTAYRVND